MTSVVHDVYGLNLASSGKLKLRAKGLLADGTDDAIFDACVLLHEAARIQRLALQSLLVCPPTTQLMSAVEECWCYVEGSNPPRAAEAWGDVLRAREGVEQRAAESILSRLEPRFKATQQDFARAVGAAPTLLALRDARRLAGLMPSELTKARTELAAVLAKFPGTVSFWWMDYRLSETDNKKREAWDALARCRRLAPENPRFAAMSLLVAAWALPKAAAEEQLATVRGALERAEPEVCLMYALAEITLARKEDASQDRKVRWRWARDATASGIAKAHTEALRKNLRATQLLVNELLAGREPTMEILYLAGLSELAAVAKANTNIADLLTTRFRRDTPGRDRDEAA